jgi:hypothetical protein
MASKFSDPGLHFSQFFSLELGQFCENLSFPHGGNHLLAEWAGKQPLEHPLELQAYPLTPRS